MDTFEKRIVLKTLRFQCGRVKTHSENALGCGMLKNQTFEKADTVYDRLRQKCIKLCFFKRNPLLQTGKNYQNACVVGKSLQCFRPNSNENGKLGKHSVEALCELR